MRGGLGRGPCRCLGSGRWQGHKDPQRAASPPQTAPGGQGLLSPVFPGPASRARPQHGVRKDPGHSYHLDAEARVSAVTQGPLWADPAQKAHEVSAARRCQPAPRGCLVGM